MAVAPWLVVKNAVFTILVPGTITVLLPYWILAGDTGAAIGDWTWLEVLGIGVIGLGLGVYLRCLWSFAAYGGATPAPVDAPKVLVVEGLYRYVRNPMYLGVFATIVGEALLFRAIELAAYAGVCWLVWHLVVVFYEEPTLQRDQDEPYVRYRNTVPRWWPRLTPANLEGPSR